MAPAVVTRWFRQCGGMRPFDPKPHSGRYLSFSDREEIALLNAQGKGVRGIAREVGRDPATISRELRRNAATRCGKLDYRASVGQWKSDMAARRPKTSKLVADPRLHAYVQERLSGEISTPGGRAIAGPSTGAWRGGTSRTARTAPGYRRGVRNRSRTGSRLMSRMMSACASATRRSTRRFTMLVHLPREEGYRHKQSRHHSPEFGAGRLWKRTQRFLQNIPGVRHVDERGLRMGRGWEAQVQVAAGLSQERPVVPERGFHRPVPQAVPQPGPGVIVLTLRALDLGAGALGQPGNSTGPRAPDGRDRIFGAKRAGPSTRHRPFGWSSCSRSCRTA